jgi:hypothetical protein
MQRPFYSQMRETASKPLRAWEILELLEQRISVAWSDRRNGRTARRNKTCEMIYSKKDCFRVGIPQNDGLLALREKRSGTAKSYLDDPDVTQEER